MTLREIRHAVDVWLDRHIYRIMVAALIGAFVLLFFADRIVHLIPAGHAGVVWRPFAGGTRVDRVYAEGVRFLWPWDVLTIYDLRYQLHDQEFTAVDSAGLQFTVQVSTRARLQREYLGRMHQLVGPTYAHVVLLPEVSGHARAIMAHYTAEEVYSRDREAIQAEILRRVQSEIFIARNPEYNFVEVEDVLIRQIILPPIVATAIQEKIRQLHMDQEWVFRLQREAKESTRKAIEAEGIRQFQDIVSRGISESYLKWKGIDATLKLAESPNAKVVIIGSGPQGLPIILGNERPTATTPPGVAQQPDRPGEPQPTRPATGEDSIGGAAAPAATAPKTESSAASKPAVPGAPETATRIPGPPAPHAGSGGISGFFSRLFGRGR